MGGGWSQRGPCSIIDWREAGGVSEEIGAEVLYEPSQTEHASFQVQAVLCKITPVRIKGGEEEEEVLHQPTVLIVTGV